ncbi:BTAD domain-containing putative transcriptional regulator [Geodermatophilus sp. URMC 64]
MTDRTGLRVLVLGPTEVRRGGEVRELRGGAPRRLLTVLAAARGEPVTDVRLAELLWGGAPPDRWAATLQSHVSRLRTALGDDDRSVLRRAGDGYALVLPAGALDADTAAQLVARAAAEADPRAAVAHLTAALELWRGTPFDDAGDDDLSGVGPERARLTELREQAIEQRLALRLGLGDAVAVLPELTARTAERPFRERGWELLVLALYRTGRQGDALAALRRVRSLLDAELGISPGEELQRLESAVLNQDPRLLLGAPPAPAAAPRTPIRRPATRFVGRGTELARLAAAVADAPLITVTGPGGVGKTRLVVELLADRADPDGPWLVRLADVSGAGFVALSVAAALGLSEVHGDGVAAVTTALAGRRGLLVLDNCEHVLDETAELVARLLDAAPGLTVLATSREPLGVEGEVVLPLAPLAGDAVALLTDRVAAVRPGWTPSAEDAEALTRIATALDGLPLALELAAARSRLLALPELAGHLHDALTFSARTGRGGLNPHATLAAAIDWSLELLAPAERDLVLRLWPFDGGLTVDAAEAVAGAEVLPRLAALVSRSVLTADTARTPTRFTLLETVRARCRELDPAPEQSRRAHAEWVRALVADVDRGMQGPAAGAVTRRMAAELPNLRAALAHDLESAPVEALRSVARLDWWWYRRGAATEGLRWLGAALAAAPDGPAVWRARAQTALASLRALDGDMAGALAAFDAAAAELDAAPPDDPELPATRVLVTHYAALAALYTGDLATAERTARANLAPARALGLGPLVAAQEIIAGAAAGASGRLAEGTALLRTAIRTGEDVGHAWAVALAERILAALVLGDGRPGEALDLVVRAGRRSVAEDDLSAVLSGLMVAAPALAALGRPRDAAAVAAAVLARARRVGVRLEFLSIGLSPDLLAPLAAAGAEADRGRGTRTGEEGSLAELAALAG